MDEKRKRQQEDFKRSLQDQKVQYQQELARRLQRVYNKPLMLETVTGKVDKFVMNKNIQAKLDEIQYEDAEEPQGGNENINSNVQNEDDLYEGKFDA